MLFFPRRKLLLGCAAGICAPAIVRAQTLLELGAGSIAKVSSGGGYTGPGDVVAGASWWFGLRAYSGASIGNNAIRLRRDSDNTEQSFTTVSGGGLDTAGITSFKGAANLFVTKLFDQTGNSNDVAQATTANQPSFTLSGLGSLPIMTGSGSPQTLTSAGNGPTLSQPLTISAVYNKTNTGATAQALCASGSGGTAQVYASGDAVINLYAGGVGANVAAADSTYHAVQGIFNSASSVVYLDGSATTVDPNTGGAGGAPIFIFRDPFSQFLSGVILEVGLWSGGFNSTQRSNMNSNQHTYWGF